MLIINKYYTAFKKKKKTLFCLFLLAFISSCSPITNLAIEKEDTRFIEFENSENDNHESINLSTSYIENDAKICVYISQDIKLVKEVSVNQECPGKIN